MTALSIRPATSDDAEAIWAIIEPVIRAGDVFALPRNMVRDDAIAYWLGGDHIPFIAEENDEIIGSYYIRPNQMGGGAHVANAGYATAQAATGRGVARAMCLDSLDEARGRGFRAMQFNFVVSSNVRAAALWRSLGFAEVGRLPGAFDHPALGSVDALVMWRAL
ncbi:GNAT family N-acetyltransferase [Sphingobium phenoxybenzoativorans]|uniref:GNAT family N-acetyltransferase n=1 Tax=Sphingobium phenoxybenzoativorans TaxID=1592790 RepID=A0A975PZC8_9SPHN|nr:GNAT family N-acetyltransferase [Sphingobium phenoxybenzoativorans]QUT03895.1 GNAT family N-acetyltransferase [Sphingobium phenoxybenzoativorans]